MKKYLLILSLFVLGLSACKKEETFDPSAQSAKDDAAIQAYLAANPSIHATKHSSGLYYQIITEGTGANPKTSSSVTVNYVGALLSGTEFERNNSVSFTLLSVIQGWTIGIPLVKSGGRILLIIPSGLAYGNVSPSPKIPQNAVLVFTVDLLATT